MTASERLRELVLAKLSGRKIDVVGFMDELLELAEEVGAIRCSFSGDTGLRFEMPSRDICVVEVDAPRAKLRMLCARLHALVDVSASSGSPYGGEGMIQKTSPGQPGNGEASKWFADFRNSPAEQEFTVRSV